MQHLVPDPHSTTPGALIGYRRDGRPIHLMAGADENGSGQQSGQGGSQQGSGTSGQQNAGGQGSQDGAGSQAGQGGAQNAGQGTGAGGQQHGNDQGNQGGAGSWRMEDLPDGARSYIQGLRDEAATNRTAKNTAEQQSSATLEAVKQALGLTEQPTVEQVTSQLAAAQTQARQAQVELAVRRVAGTHSGDPDALLDSRAFLDAVRDLDPTAHGFGDQVSTAVKNAVEANSRLKAQAAGGGEGGTARGGRAMGQGGSGGSASEQPSVKSGRDLYASKHPQKQKT